MEQVYGSGFTTFCLINPQWECGFGHKNPLVNFNLKKDRNCTKKIHLNIFFVRFHSCHEDRKITISGENLLLSGSRYRHRGATKNSFTAPLPGPGVVADEFDSPAVHFVALDIN